MQLVPLEDFLIPLEIFHCDFKFFLTNDSNFHEIISLYRNATKEKCTLLSHPHAWRGVALVLSGPVLVPKGGHPGACTSLVLPAIAHLLT